ncbi:YdcF family protein [Corynebacterium cystitidis]|uniref:YdcF family protein n=1 Tax=Corynebacterium cystitidis TaxID=35757 RepID=UPI00211E7036|nr:YdcF family protein [Corynebacterium cystitidis]
MNKRTHTVVADPIVVLGARVHADRPGKLLERRLAVAARLYAASARTIIVSGRGEASVMADWLLAHGVDPADIVQDNAATSTNENLENSRALAPHAGVLHVVTSNFHALRTRVWAWHLRIPVRIHLASTPEEARAFNYVREIVALPHSIVRVVWRRIKACFDARCGRA